jgi:hypothetical protein
MLVTKRHVVGELLTGFLVGGPRRIPLRAKAREDVRPEEVAGAPIR